jgi:broad specificity phosphatase PhoE
MKIILTRHGRTVENDAGILQGHLPGTLNDTGKEQARKLAERLSWERIDRAYSSDLARAADTANTIMAFHPDTPLEFTEELREASLGDWQ